MTPKTASKNATENEVTKKFQDKRRKKPIYWSGMFSYNTKLFPLEITHYGFAKLIQEKFLCMI